MMDNNNNGLTQRLLFLTKTLFTLFIMTFLIYLNFLDLKENNKNISDLNLLKSITEKYHAGELAFKDYELKRLDSLKVIDSSTYVKHYQSRIALVRMLNKYGAFITNTSKGGGKSKNNIIILMSNESLRKSIKSKIINPTLIFENEHSDSNKDFQHEDINDAIDIFNTYPQQEEVELLTDVDTILLKQKCDSLLKKSVAEKNNNQQNTTVVSRDGRTVTVTSMEKLTEQEMALLGNGGGNGPHYVNAMTGETVEPNEKHVLFTEKKIIQGICISENKVVIFLEDGVSGNHNSVGGNGNQGETLKLNDTIVIPAKTETRVFPSTLFFANYPSKLIQELYKENNQTNLGNEYGNARLSMIDNISIDIYNQNNSPISVLGFDLSRKWFPIALLLVITIILIILFSTIKNSRLSSTLIITDNSTEDVLGFLLKNKTIRLFLWIIAPALILFLVLSSSPINYGNVIFFSLLSCCVLSTIFGVISYVWSLKL